MCPAYFLPLLTEVPLTNLCFIHKIRYFRISAVIVERDSDQNLLLRQISFFLTSGVKHISLSHLHREVSPHSLDTYYESHGETHTHIHTRSTSQTYTQPGATTSGAPPTGVHLHIQD